LGFGHEAGAGVNAMLKLFFAQRSSLKVVPQPVKESSQCGHIPSVCANTLTDRGWQKPFRGSGGKRRSQTLWKHLKPLGQFALIEFNHNGVPLPRKHGGS
jgi:hypothetical protein